MCDGSFSDSYNNIIINRNKLSTFSNKVKRREARLYDILWNIFVTMQICQISSGAFSTKHVVSHSAAFQLFRQFAEPQSWKPFFSLNLLIELLDGCGYRRVVKISQTMNLPTNTHDQNGSGDLLRPQNVSLTGAVEEFTSWSAIRQSASLIRESLPFSFSLYYRTTETKVSYTVVISLRGASNRFSSTSLLCYEMAEILD